MNGKLIGGVIVASAALAGAVLYYLQVYGFYYEPDAQPGREVMLVAQAGGDPEPIAYDDFRAITADSSPIRYRACFTTSVDPAELAAVYKAAPGHDPRNAPGWFDCFDAGKIATGIADGSVQVFLGAKNIAYGVDRIVAVANDGRGWIWHDLNDCGEKAYDGTVTGEACPPRPAGD